MKKNHKNINQLFFKRLIQIMPEGGIYIWPDANETFQFKNGLIVGSTIGILKIKEITPLMFHSKLVAIDQLLFSVDELVA